MLFSAGVLSYFMNFSTVSKGEVLDILWMRETVENRIRELGGEISAFYEKLPLTLVVVMNGGALFGAELALHITVRDLYLDSIATSSYVNDTNLGHVKLRSQLKLPVAGRHVLLLDEVLDSGNTLKRLIGDLSTLGAASVRTAVLVEKLRPHSGLAHADWTGFTAPDRYLVGYGMDSNELYRNLPYIAALD